jgi:hypothetical protein
MFEKNRFQLERNKATGHMDWFFDAREGTMGPFESWEAAERALKRHVEHCIRNGLDGGRRLGLDSAALKLELESLPS